MYLVYIIIYIIYNNGYRNGPAFHLKRHASAAVLCEARIVFVHNILYCILLLLLFYHVHIHWCI